jgi:hypothetical protein
MMLEQEPVSDRKSFELYVQTAAWTGGIAAAATGGVLLALLNPDVPRDLITWLRWIGISLLVALCASAYLQFHGIAVLNAKERDDQASVTRNSKNLSASQLVMFLSLGCGAVLLVIGLFRFEREPKSLWTVGGVSRVGSESLVVITRPGADSVKVLSRGIGQQTWLVTDVALSPIVAAPVRNEDLKKEGEKPADPSSPAAHKD